MKSLIRKRMELGLNQTEFWGAIGVNQSVGSRYETGRTIPRPVLMLLKLKYKWEPK